MNLYEYLTPDGNVAEIVADGHVAAWDFFQAAKERFDVELNPGSITHMWEQRAKGSERRLVLNKLQNSAPITVGIIKTKVI